MSYDEFKALNKRFHKLAKNKLGFPTSFLSTKLEFVNNEILGIKPRSLASILINEVGDPFKKSETWRIEVKNYEMKIINVLSNYFGIHPGDGRGYVPSGGTEANEASIVWLKKALAFQLHTNLQSAKKLKNLHLREIAELEQAILQNAAAANIDLLKKLHDLNVKYRKQQHIIEQIETITVICTENYTHYSIYKISNHLNLRLLSVKYNPDGSMNLTDFKKIVTEQVRDFPHSPIIVNSNMGTTRTGAIDNLPEIKRILDGLNPKPAYAVHLDGSMFGLLMPILKPFGEVKNYFELADTMSISFHKYLGISQPSGIALTTKKIVKSTYRDKKNKVEYAGNIIDITIAGSRSGLNILLIYNAIFNGLQLHRTTSMLEQIIAADLQQAKYFYEKLVATLGEENILFVPNQFNIVIPKPPKALIKKYQLMIEKDRAVICVWNNVTTELIDKFMQDLNASIKEDKHLWRKSNRPRPQE